ncbi:MAG: TolC family protein [Synechococcaceae bacterium WBB_3_034]|nr:TolC family protein [Synechococcaceae bacterium WBB_3_034]
MAKPAGQQSSAAADQRRVARCCPALALLLGLSPLLGGNPAAAQAAPRATASTELLERNWQRLDAELRALDQLLPADPQPPVGDGLTTPALPANLIRANQPPQGTLQPRQSLPAAPLALPTPQQLRNGSIAGLSLEQALAVAFANSANLQAQREQVAAALASFQAASGTYWPTLSAFATGAYEGNRTLTTSLQSNSWLPAPLFSPNGLQGSNGLPTAGPFYVPDGGYAAITTSVTGFEGGLQLNYALLDFARTPRVLAARASLEQQRSTYANGLRVLQLQVSEAYYQLQRARRRLGLLLNLPPEITPSASDPIQVQPRWPLNLEESLLAAYRGNPELEAVLATRAALAQQKQATAAGLLPRLSLFAASGGTGSQTSLSNIELGGGGCCGSTALPLSAKNGWDWSVGLSLTWLLFDAGTTAGQARALARREAAAAQQYAASRNDIRLRLEQSFFNHEASLAKLSSARRGVAAALEAFRDVRLRYTTGLSSELDVSITQDRLINSLVQRLNATIGVNLTYAQLLRELLPMPRNPAEPLDPQLQLKPQAATTTSAPTDRATAPPAPPTRTTAPAGSN